MLTVSQNDTVGTPTATDLTLLGAALLALHEWSITVGTLIFAALGSLTLNTVLYRSRLVPRWLSGWGILGAGMLLLYGLLGVLGRDTSLGSPFMLLAMPIALEEMVFAGWLLIRGFDAHVIALDDPSRPRVEVMT